MPSIFVVAEFPISTSANCSCRVSTNSFRVLQVSGLLTSAYHVIPFAAVSLSGHCVNPILCASEVTRVAPRFMLHSTRRVLI